MHHMHWTTDFVINIVLVIHRHFTKISNKAKANDATWPCVTAAQWVWDMLKVLWIVSFLHRLVCAPKHLTRCWVVSIRGRLHRFIQTKSFRGIRTLKTDWQSSSVAACSQKCSQLCCYRKILPLKTAQFADGNCTCVEVFSGMTQFGDSVAKQLHHNTDISAVWKADWWTADGDGRIRTWRWRAQLKVKTFWLSDELNTVYFHFTSHFWLKKTIAVCLYVCFCCQLLSPLSHILYHYLILHSFLSL